MYYGLSCGSAKRKCIEQFQRGHLLFRKLFKGTTFCGEDTFKWTVSTGTVERKLIYPEGEAVFSPNPMWYHPNWSCDFRCNLCPASNQFTIALTYIMVKPTLQALAAWNQLDDQPALRISWLTSTRTLFLETLYPRKSNTVLSLHTSFCVPVQ